ncbi:MAG: type II toxin-antitoxin system VapB family antitoxin [Chloroflexota bacterium]
MSKTTVDVNDEKVEAAREILGTRTLRDTIDRALDSVLAVAARRRLVERLERMEGLELNDPEVMASAWH